MATRAQIFRKFVEVLQADLTLQGLVSTWCVWLDGDGSEQVPGVAQCPWVRLSPYGGHTEWKASGVLEAKMAVHVETMTAGNETDASSDLWDAIEGVLLSPGLDAAMQAVEVWRTTPHGQAFGVRPHYHRWEPAVAGAVYNDCDVELMMNRPA